MRLPGRLAIALAALAAGACGGAGEDAAIPRAVADRLAARSETIARALEANDGCEAAAQARRLRSEARGAIAGGDVPPELADDLRRSVNELVAQIECVSPPPPPPATPTEEDADEPTAGEDEEDEREGREERDDKGKDDEKEKRGKGKGKGKKGRDD